MRWTVETFDGVDAEIEALPPGLQARLIRLMEAVENVENVENVDWSNSASRMSSISKASSGSCAPRQASARHLCDGHRPPRRHYPRLRQEIAEDTNGRARSGA